METIEGHYEWQLVKNEPARVCAATGMTIHSPFPSLQRYAWGRVKRCL